MRCREQRNGTYWSQNQNQGNAETFHQSKVWVTAEERSFMTERAELTGLSLFTYLRGVGLNKPVCSVLDLKAVADLVKLNGDLGRMAGLRKLWLAETWSGRSFFRGGGHDT
ncbi:plasmid mobilization protein [Rhizobium sp. CFBP 8762]|uniref:plasmid mobilization protein n=1 Tax=Rhizobium sp. CFBP 8762 TaxID=2775279 RepID=UPI00406CCB5B